MFCIDFNVTCGSKLYDRVRDSLDPDICYRVTDVCQQYRITDVQFTSYCQHPHSIYIHRYTDVATIGI